MVEYPGRHRIFPFTTNPRAVASPSENMIAITLVSHDASSFGLATFFLRSSSHRGICRMEAELVEGSPD